jgi:hypothetical protein
VTLSGDNLTASRFLESPTLVARRLQELAQLRYIGTMILKGRVAASGGSVLYEQVEALFADKAPEAVAPGANYTRTTASDGPAALAKVTKQGEDLVVTDEAIARRKMDPIVKGTRKLVNSTASQLDATVIAAVASQVTANANAVAKWDRSGGAAAVLQDIMLAIASITGQNLGYNPDLLLVDDTTWAYLASDTTIAAAMAREDKSNPIYSGRFEVLSGLEIVHVPAANLPGGVGTSAWVLDSSQLGYLAFENLGGGYQSAGELIESKVIRDEDNDQWRVRARTNFVPIVTDPLAGYKINTVR